jgi:hypothetical protein
VNSIGFDSILITEKPGHRCSLLDACSVFVVYQDQARLRSCQCHERSESEYPIYTNNMRTEEANGGWRPVKSGNPPWG